MITIRFAPVAKFAITAAILLNALNCAAQSKEAFTPDNYEEVAGSGKGPDYMLCGFNPNKTTMKQIIAKLGQQTSKAPSDDVNYFKFTWDKGPLKINVSTYISEFTPKPFPDNTPATIKIEGSDPDHVCQTGRGLVLGDSIDRAMKLYAKKYHKVAMPKDHKIVVFKWGDGITEVSVDVQKDGTISSIETEGDVE
jgi:hypothetical protein